MSVFDWDKFEKGIHRVYGKFIDGDHPTVVFLEMHMLIERHLKWSVMTKLPKPEKFKDAKLSFGAVVRLAASLELIDDKQYEALIYIGNIRDNLAHQLEFELTNDVPLELIRILELYPANDKMYEFPGNLGAIMFLLHDNIAVHVLQRLHDEENATLINEEEQNANSYSNAPETAT